MKESVKSHIVKMVLNYYGQSCREVFNVIQANEIGADIITCQQMLLRKLTIILDAILMNCQWIQFKDLQKILKVLDYQYYKITISNYDQPSLRLQTCLRLGFNMNIKEKE